MRVRILAAPAAAIEPAASGYNARLT